MPIRESGKTYTTSPGFRCRCRYWSTSRWCSISYGGKSNGAAAGAGLGFYFLTLLLASWGPAARYGFVGLWPAISGALVGKGLALGWPVATAVVAIAVGGRSGDPGLRAAGAVVFTQDADRVDRPDHALAPSR